MYIYTPTPVCSRSPLLSLLKKHPPFPLPMIPSPTILFPSLFLSFRDYGRRLVCRLATPPFPPALE